MKIVGDMEIKERNEGVLKKVSKNVCKKLAKKRSKTRY